MTFLAHAFDYYVPHAYMAEPCTTNCRDLTSMVTANVMTSGISELIKS